MSVLATDDFNRANGPVGADWTNTPGVGGGIPNIVSNQVEGSGTRNMAYYDAISWPNNQYAQVKAVALEAALMVRAVLNGGETDCYYALARVDTDAISIIEYLNNVGGTTLSSGTATLVTGDAVKLEIRGNALTLFIQGSSVLTASDGTWTAGNAGMGVGNVGGDQVDDFEGGDFPLDVVMVIPSRRPRPFAPGLAR